MTEHADTNETTEVVDPPTEQTEDPSVDKIDQPEETEDSETFPREYVVKLREEAAKHRTRAGDRDTLAQRLHTALVTATGRLADPSDLPFDNAHLADPDALSAAVDNLLARKPHLATRRPVGDVGQGVTGSDSSVDLAGMLRRNAS